MCFHVGVALPHLSRSRGKAKMPHGRAAAPGLPAREKASKTTRNGGHSRAAAQSFEGATFHASVSYVVARPPGLAARAVFGLPGFGPHLPVPDGPDHPAVSGPPPPRH